MVLVPEQTGEVCVLPPVILTRDTYATDYSFYSRVDGKVVKITPLHAPHALRRLCVDLIYFSHSRLILYQGSRMKAG